MRWPTVLIAEKGEMCFLMTRVASFLLILARKVVGSGGGSTDLTLTPIGEAKMSFLICVGYLQA